MNIEQFLDYEVPFCLQADAYTISSDAFASEKAKEKSVYNITNRISPAVTFPDIAKDSRMVFFGLQDYIRRNLTKPITQLDIDKSKRFMNRACSFGGPLPFNKEMWESVLHDYNGYLPIKIKGIKEGSVFFPNEPVIEVSAEDGFGELAAHIEGVLLGQWANMTCRATITAHFQNTIREYLLNDCGQEEFLVDGVIDWFIHDFGLRASSVNEESELLGKAHLLFFLGTDTFNAAYSAWRDSNFSDNPVGTSITALAHRNILGFENDNTDGELDCFNKLYEVSKTCGNIASYVSDCYNFTKAVDKLESILKENPDSKVKIVSRPDSGNAVNNIDYILSKDNSNLRFIEGNGVKPKALLNILSCLKDKDVFSRGIFGIGGYLRNACNRDTLSSKFALSAIGKENRPVCKLSEEIGKISIPGPTLLTKPTLMWGYKSVFFDTEFPEHNNRLYTYYNGCNIISRKYSDICLEDFDVIRDRAKSEFKEYSKFAQDNPNYGTDCKHLSSSVQDFRQKTLDKHKD